MKGNLKGKRYRWNAPSFSIRKADYQDVDDGSGSLGEYALALALGGMAIVWHDCASGQTARPYARRGCTAPRAAAVAAVTAATVLLLWPPS